MSTSSTHYSFSGVATTATTIGMAGLLLLGGAAAGAPAKAADATPAGDTSVAAAGAHHSKAQVALHAPSAATKGDSITLKGKVKKTHHHKTRVVIQKKHGKKWQKVDATKTTKKGKFHTADAFGKKHKVKLRAKATGHGVSNTQMVTFTNPTPPPPPPPPDNGGGTGDGGGDVQPSQPQAQSITWDTDLGGDHAVGDSMPLKAHAQSGETVTYTSSNTNAATISGNKLTFKKFGESTTITAKVAGDANWKPASTAKTVKVDANKSASNGNELQDAITEAGSNPTVIQLKGTDFTHAPQDGHGDDDAFIVPDDAQVTLIGKGTLDGRNQMRVMEVAGKLTISGDIKITDGSASDGAGILNKGAVTLNSGTITDNGADYGGGIYSVRGTVALNGGTITGNTATAWGGGIYHSDGTVPLNGGQVGSDKPRDGNTAKLGGGIYNIGPNAKVTLNGGSIENNQAEDEGGGIYNTGWNDRLGVVTMLGGSITGNTAGIHGGGIYSYGPVTLTGGKITKNHADSEAGGIFMNGGELKVNDQKITNEDAAKMFVYGNTATYSKNIAFRPKP